MRLAIQGKEERLVTRKRNRPVVVVVVVESQGTFVHRTTGTHSTLSSLPPENGCRLHRANECVTLSGNKSNLGMTHFITQVKGASALR